MTATILSTCRAAAKTFSGAKEGYSFKTGPQGPGYYKDSTNAGLAPGAAAAGSAGWRARHAPCLQGC